MLPLLAGPAAGCGASRRSDVSTRPHAPVARTSLLRIVVFDGDLRRRGAAAPLWGGPRGPLAGRRGGARGRIPVDGPPVELPSFPHLHRPRLPAASAMDDVRRRPGTDPGPPRHQAP